MEKIHTREQVTIYIINNHVMLDALKNWAVGNNTKITPLDKYLWDTLNDYVSTHHSAYSIDHVQHLFNDFRIQESNRTTDRQNRCGQVLEVGLRYMANTYFEWRNGVIQQFVAINCCRFKNGLPSATRNRCNVICGRSTGNLQQKDD